MSGWNRQRGRGRDRAERDRHYAYGRGWDNGRPPGGDNDMQGRGHYGNNRQDDYAYGRNNDGRARGDRMPPGSHGHYGNNRNEYFQESKRPRQELEQQHQREWNGNSTNSNQNMNFRSDSFTQNTSCTKMEDSKKPIESTAATTSHLDVKMEVDNKMLPKTETETGTSIIKNENNRKVVVKKEEACPLHHNPNSGTAQFKQKDYNEKLLDLLPPGVDANHLPPVRIPPKWDQLKPDAVDKTIKYLRNELLEKYFPSDSDEDDSDDSGSSANTPPYGDMIVTKADRMRNYSPFVNSLPHCIPMEIGFHAVMLESDADTWCYCPCGRHMKLWRKKFNLDGLVEQCTADKKYEPRGLLAHLKSKDCFREREGLIYHDMVYKYLEELFSDYYGHGWKHKAFYYQNTKECKGAIAAEERINASVISKLKQQLDEERKKSEELEKTKERLATLQETNKDLHEQFQALQKLKGKLGIKEENETKTIITETMKKRFQNQHKRFFKEKHSIFLPSDVESVVPLSIPLSQKFSLQNWFDDLWQWSKKSKVKSEKNVEYEIMKYLLLEEVSLHDKKSLKHFPRMFVPWNIEFGFIELEGAKINPRYTNKNKGLKAIDQGGPTRQFLSGVWKQMGDLHVNINEKKCVKLFAIVPTGYIPMPNDFIESYLKGCDDECAMDKKIKAYYRAIGRIMLQCLATDEGVKSERNNDGERAGNTIASACLPLLYRNKILRGIEPRDKDYPLNDLVKHSVDLLEKKKDTTFEDMCGFFGIDTSDEDGFRKSIHEQFIEGRSIAIEALTEGLMLNGCADLSVHLGLMPLEAVNEICFSKSNISVEDVRDALIRTDVDIDDTVEASAIEICSANMNLLFSKIKDEFLEEQSEADPEFLQKFVTFCTGQNHVPNNSVHKFNIKIEFSFLKDSQSLPWTHTCENTLGLPATAYDGNKDLFAEKLLISMGNCEGFTME